MLLALLALAAVSIPEAQTYLSGQTQYPDAVRFRNMRVAGDTVCGEINSPVGTQMTGYFPFAYRRHDSWVRGTAEGFGGVVRDNRFEDSGVLIGLIRAAERHNDRTGLTVNRQRKQAFEARARELLARCHQPPLRNGRG